MAQKSFKKKRTKNHVYFFIFKCNSEDRRLKFGETWFLVKRYSLMHRESKSVQGHVSYGNPSIYNLRYSIHARKRRGYNSEIRHGVHNYQIINITKSQSVSIVTLFVSYGTTTKFLSSIPGFEMNLNKIQSYLLFIRRSDYIIQKFDNVKSFKLYFHRN